jgi:hypothetical protein
MSASERDRTGQQAACAAALVIALAAMPGCGSRTPAPASPMTAGATFATPAPEPVRAGPPARPGVLVTAPRFAATLQGEERGEDMTAVIRLAGRAAPRAALELVGSCGTIACDEITFADRRGRWQKSMQLTTPPGRRVVLLRVGYAEPRRGDRAIRTRFRIANTPSPRGASDLLPPVNAGPRGGETRALIVIGDSLAVGMAAYLQPALPGWSVAVDGRIGRPLAEGMQILSARAVPPAAGGHGAILAFSLFTNDSPTNVDALEAAVRTSVARAGSRGCAVWATIVRPPLAGVSYDAANERLHELAGDARLAQHLVLVPWAEAIRAHPEWLAGDGVHSTGDGYAARAHMYAEAARSCPV